MGQIPLVIMERGGVNVDTGSSADAQPSINSIRLALEEVSLQGMEDEKEFAMRTPRSSTASTIRIKSPGIPVIKDNLRGGVCPLSINCCIWCD